MASTCAAMFFLLTAVFCAANCRLNEEQLNWMLQNDEEKLELMLQVAKGYMLEHIDSKDLTIHILVAGRVGVGKSALVNALVGMKVAKTGYSMMTVTNETNVIAIVKDDVYINITDTPGLEGIGKKDNVTVKKIQKKCKDVDVFLFCLKMSERFRDHVGTIKTVTRILGRDIWKKGLFALTFANTINGKESFTSTLHRREEEIREMMPTIIDPEIAKVIPIVPVGSKKPQLPDRSSWFSDFWIQAFRKTNFFAMLRLFLLNHKRLRKAVYDVNLAEGNPDDQPLVNCYVVRIQDPNTKDVCEVVDDVFTAVHSKLPVVRDIIPLSLAHSVGNWTRARFLNTLDWGTKELHCDDDVIWPSMYAAFLKEYPKYEEMLYKLLLQI